VTASISSQGNPSSDLGRVLVLNDPPERRRRRRRIMTYEDYDEEERDASEAAVAGLYCERPETVLREIQTLHPPSLICPPLPESSPPQPYPNPSLTGGPSSTALPYHPRLPSVSLSRLRALETAGWSLQLVWSNRRPCSCSRSISRERQQLPRLPRLPPVPARAWRHHAQPCVVPVAKASDGTSNELGKTAGFRPPTLRFK